MLSFDTTWSYRPHADVRQRMPARDRLLSLVLREPGLPCGELAKKLDMRLGTLYYHLERLEARGLVNATAHGRRRLVFPAGDAMDSERARAIALLRGGTVHRVANAVATQPGGSLDDVVRWTNVCPRTVYYHLRHLRKVGLVLSAAPRRYLDLRPAPLLAELLVDPRATPNAP